MIASVFALALLLQSADAPAPTPPPAPAAKPAKAAPDPNEVICQSRPVIGSRLIKEKVCQTRAQWDQANNVTQQNVSNMQATHGGGAQPGH